MSNIIDSIQLSGVTYQIQGSGSTIIDPSFDSGSTNPVENRVITPAVTKHFEGEYPTEYTGGYSGGTYVGGFSAETYEEAASYVIRNTTYTTKMYKDGIRMKFIDAEGVETEVFACSASTYYNRVYNPPSSYANITIDTVGKNIEITPLDNYKLSYVVFYGYYDNNLMSSTNNAFSAFTYQSFDKTAIQLIDELSAQKQDKIPISAGTGTNSIIEGNSSNTASSYYSHAEGSLTTASGQSSHAEGSSTKANGYASHAEGNSTSAMTSSSHAEGYRTLANGDYSHTEGNNTTASGYSSHAEGDYTKANGMASHAEGYWTTAATDYSHTEGYYTETTNQSEHASGQYNVSNSATTTFGDSGNTLFSVGNGDWSARHNAFEIRQNGDIYLSSGGTDIKLQDHLGGGGGGSSYTAGDGIDITNNVISVTGKADTSAVTEVSDALTAHTADTTIHVTSTEKAAWNAKSDFSGDYNDLANKPTIPTVPTSNTAFTNDAGYITIDAISGKVDTSTYNTYTAATDTALASKADTATTYTKTEVDNAITAATSTKQDTLVSGTNIKTINNESLLGSGNIDIQGSGNPTVELTQAEYDALVTAGTVSADTYYIITDAQAGDLTNYYTKTETNTLLGGKQATLVSGTNIKTINNESLLGSGNIDIQGGGKAIEAGRGISVTTGETADTVSFNLPISANTNNSIVMGGKISNSFTNNGRDCLMVGSDDTISNGSDCCLVVGYRCSANGDGSAVIGWESKSTGDNSFAFGYSVNALKSNSFATGYRTITNNNYETAFGKDNASNTGSTDVDKTIFSVGNGTAANARHNAFEIRQDGSIYCSDGTNDVKLQDTITATAANTTALGGLSLVKLTQAQYDALATKDNSTLYVIVN